VVRADALVIDWRNKNPWRLSNLDIRWYRQMRVNRTMLWTIAVILLILWLLGFSFHVAGGLIHIILVIAVIVVVIRLVTGRAP
jgi:hypothetical protein